LVGAVLAGTRGRPAETRTGAARLLTTHLNQQEAFMATCYGQASNNAGGYLIQCAHASVGEGLGAITAAEWVTIAQVVAIPNDVTEVAISGAQVWNAVRAASSLGSVTGGEDSRAVAVRAVAGTGDIAITNIALTSNVATVTIGAHTLVVGQVVEVKNCSNAVFNGVYTLTAVDATTISYARTNANVTSASATGTVTNGVAAPVGAMTICLEPA
jgi:hypothetical protein